MEEYKRTLSVPTTRIEESDAQEDAEEPERDIDSFYRGHIRFHFCMQSILTRNSDH